MRTTTGSWPACSPVPTGSTHPSTSEWNSLLGLLERHRANPKAALNCGVLANLVGIAAFGDAADFAALDGAEPPARQ